MEDYNSKYSGEQVDKLLDKAEKLNVEAVDTGDVIDDVDIEYATIAYVDNKIANISLTDYATIAYVDGLIGDINSVLESIINGSANIITFSIYQTPFETTIEYQAESGMTWEAWCNSSYNTSGYYVEGSNIADGNDYGVFVGLDGVNVLSTDIIQANTTYEWN